MSWFGCTKPFFHRNVNTDHAESVLSAPTLCFYYTVWRFCCCSWCLRTQRKKAGAQSRQLEKKNMKTKFKGEKKRNPTAGICHTDMFTGRPFWQVSRPHSYGGGGGAPPEAHTITTLWWHLKEEAVLHRHSPASCLFTDLYRETFSAALYIQLNQGMSTFYAFFTLFCMEKDWDIFINVHE